MELSASAIRAYRLHAHHLDRPVSLREAASCGFQNSPAGAWENAAFFRAAPWQKTNCCRRGAFAARLSSSFRMTQMSFWMP